MEENKERGMTVKAVSRKADVEYSLLQPSLKGHRQLRADEYLRICAVLGISPKAYVLSRKPSPENTEHLLLVEEN